MVSKRSIASSCWALVFIRLLWWALVLLLELLTQQLVLLQRGKTRLGDDVVFKVEDALDVLQRHVQHHGDAAGQRLQEPDVGDRGRQFDVAHPLAAHARHESAQQRWTPAMRYRDLLAIVHKRLAEEWGVAAPWAESVAYGRSIADWPAFPDSAASRGLSEEEASREREALPKNATDLARKLFAQVFSGVHW